MILLLALFESQALCQDSIDGHGYTHHVSDGNLKDGLYSWSSKSFESLSFGSDFIYEYASKPLTLHTKLDEKDTEEILISEINVVNSGAFFAPTKWLDLSMSAPLYIKTETADRIGGYELGDVTINSSVRIIDSKDKTLSLSVIPSLTIPGRSKSDYLKSPQCPGRLY